MLGAAEYSVTCFRRPWGNQPLDDLWLVAVMCFVFMQTIQIWWNLDGICRIQYDVCHIRKSCYLILVVVEGCYSFFLKYYHRLLLGNWRCRSCYCETGDDVLLAPLLLKGFDFEPWWFWIIKKKKILCKWWLLQDSNTVGWE